MGEMRNIFNDSVERLPSDYPRSCHGVSTLAVAHNSSSSRRRRRSGMISASLSPCQCDRGPDWNTDRQICRRSSPGTTLRDQPQLIIINIVHAQGKLTTDNIFHDPMTTPHQWKTGDDDESTGENTSDDDKKPAAIDSSKKEDNNELFRSPPFRSFSSDSENVDSHILAPTTNILDEEGIQIVPLESEYNLLSPLVGLGGDFQLDMMQLFPMEYSLGEDISDFSPLDHRAKSDEARYTLRGEEQSSSKGPGATTAPMLSETNALAFAADNKMMATKESSPAPPFHEPLPPLNAQLETSRPSRSQAKSRQPQGMRLRSQNENRQRFRDTQSIKPTPEEEKEASSERDKKALDIWYDRLNQLNAYKLEKGHCNVPQKYGKNPKLGIVSTPTLQKPLKLRHVLLST